MKLVLAKPEHKVAHQDIVQLMTKHAASLTALELLAVASNMVGKMVALQDHRTIKPMDAMEIVATNIEHGNQEAIAELMKSKGTG